MVAQATLNLGGDCLIPLADTLKHGMIAGVTGSGKSMGTIRLVDELFRLRNELPHDERFGIWFLDPKPESPTSKEIQARISGHDLSPITKQQIHVLNDGFSLSPFRDLKLQKNWQLRQAVWIELWSLGLSLVGGDQDQRETKRRYRCTKRGLYLSTSPRGDKPPLGLQNTLELCSLHGVPLMNLLEEIELPKDIRADAELTSTLPTTKFHDLIESTLHSLGYAMKEDTLSYFTDEHPPLPIEDMVMKGDVVLCNYGPHKERTPSGTLSITVFTLLRLLDAAERLRPKNPVIVFVEEAPEVLSHLMEKILQRARAAGISIFIITQSLDALKRNESLDLRNAVLNETHLKIIFRMNDPDSLEKLSVTMAAPNWDFTPNATVLDRPDGHDWVPVVEVSYGQTVVQTVTNGVSVSHAKSAGIQVGTDKGRGGSNGEAIRVTASKADQNGGSTNKSVTNSEGENETDTVTNSHTDGLSNNWEDSQFDERSGGGNSVSASTSEGNQKGKQKGRSEQDGESVTFGNTKTTGGGYDQTVARTWSLSKKFGLSVSETETFMRSVSKGLSQGESVTLSFKRIPLPRHREYWQRTGQLLRSIQDQTDFFWQVLRTLGTAQCLVSVGNQRTELCKVEFVEPAFEGRPKLRHYMMTQLVDMIRSFHDFYFDPETICKPKPKVDDLAWLGRKKKSSGDQNTH